MFFLTIILSLSVRNKEETKKWIEFTTFYQRNIKQLFDLLHMKVAPYEVFQRRNFIFLCLERKTIVFSAEFGVILV